VGSRLACCWMLWGLLGFCVWWFFGLVFKHEEKCSLGLPEARGALSGWQKAECISSKDGSFAGGVRPGVSVTAAGPWAAQVLFIPDIFCFPLNKVSASYGTKCVLYCPELSCQQWPLHLFRCWFGGENGSLCLFLFPFFFSLVLHHT